MRQVWQQQCVCVGDGATAHCVAGVWQWCRSGWWQWCGVVYRGSQSVALLLLLLPLSLALCMTVAILQNTATYATLRYTSATGLVTFTVPHHLTTVHHYRHTSVPQHQLHTTVSRHHATTKPASRHKKYAKRFHSHRHQHRSPSNRRNTHNVQKIMARNLYMYNMQKYRKFRSGKFSRLDRVILTQVFLPHDCFNQNLFYSLNH